MNKLYVFGDSFSVIPPGKDITVYFSTAAKNKDLKEQFDKMPEDTFKTWTKQVADNLNLELVNYSVTGGSQEFSCANLHRIAKDITKDDQVVMLLTHPARFWFFDDKPAVTNANISNIDETVPKNHLEAIRYYITYIQRPPLDLQLQSQRLGWMSSVAKAYNWKPIQVIFGFPPVIKSANPGDVFPYEHFCKWNDYENIRCSEGNLLMDVEQRELEESVDEFKIWQGYDTRYNHMLKSNHKVLADLLIEAIKNETNVNITSGKWLQKIITWDSFDDEEFCKKEFNPFFLAIRKKFFTKKFEVVKKPWAERIGLQDILNKRRKKD